MALVAAASFVAGHAVGGVEHEDGGTLDLPALDGLGGRVDLLAVDRHGDAVEVGCGAGRGAGRRRGAATPCRPRTARGRW